jgi:hypothetical protein
MDRTEWLVMAGRFVEDRWLAEERVRLKDQPLDEQATWALWDQCTAGDLDRLQRESHDALKTYVRNQSLAAAVQTLTGAIRPVERVLSAVGWIIKEAWRGLIAGLGLIVLGYLLVQLASPLAKTVRAAVDDAFPPVAGHP